MKKIRLIKPNKYKEDISYLNQLRKQYQKNKKKIIDNTQKSSQSNNKKKKPIKETKSSHNLTLIIEYQLQRTEDNKREKKKT